MFGKKTTIFLTILLAGTLASGVVLSARAATEPRKISPDEVELVLPESYEQYLPLSHPVSFAISDDYIAIADGSTLFFYDRVAGTYSKYSHKKYPEGTADGTISKVQIAEVEGEQNDRIFFSDTDSHLYEYGKVDGSEHSVKDMIVNNVPVTTFLVDGTGEALFTASHATESGKVSLNRYPLSDKKLESEDSTANTEFEGSSPLLTADNGKLYIEFSSNSLAIYNASDLNFIENTYLDKSSPQIAGLQSVCSFGDKIYYTVKETSPSGKNGLYVTSQEGTARMLNLGEGKNDDLSALGVYNGELYCIRGSSVHRLSFDENGEASFTDYEIGSASQSLNRLNGADDIVRAGNLLVTANKGAKRVLIRDIAEGTYRHLDLDYEPVHVATDGDLIAVSSDKSVYLYTHDFDGNYSLAFQTTASDYGITGLVCLYGACYFVTNGSGYGKIVSHTDTEGGDKTEEVKREFSLEGGNLVVRVNLGTPHALAADLYGTLYVVMQDGKVKSFTEQTFVDSGKDATDEGKTLPTDCTSVRADFEGRLYYLHDGVLCRDGESFAAIDGKDFVYTDNTEKKPVSFALGYEDDEVYFLFGDFIVKTKRDVLGFPTLGTISAEGVREKVSRVSAKEDVRLREVREGTIGIRVDLNDVLAEETAYFPYSSYSRTVSDECGVVLAETKDGGYSLLALYENGTYTVELFRERDLLEESVAPAWSEESGMKYLANDSYVFNFPCLTAAHSEERLPRGSEVYPVASMVPVITREAGSVPFAAIENAEGELLGYVPLSFLSPVDPTGVGIEKYTLGALKEDTEFGKDGESITVKAGEQVRLYDNGDGTYTAVCEREGVFYRATVDEDMISKGESDALRIALIIILTVLAVLIIAAYFFLLPKYHKN